jgi:hypothetical protein
LSEPAYDQLILLLMRESSKWLLRLF